MPHFIIVEEQNLYQRGKVTVTPSKFMVANKTYTVKNISTASVETIPANKVPLAIILVAGVLIMLVKDMLFVGAVIVAIGVVFYVLMKDEYTVRVSNSTGDTADSFTSKDRAYAEEVAGALNEAIHLATYANYTAETQYINLRPEYLSTAYKL